MLRVAGCGAQAIAGSHAFAVPQQRRRKGSAKAWHPAMTMPPSRFLTALRPVQEDPQDEVRGEVNEVVALASPDEEDIARLARPALVAPHEGGAPPEDDVHL